MYRQVQSPTAEGQYKGVWASLVRMWKEEGLRGYLRGNGINCIRIIPYRYVPFICIFPRWLSYVRTAIPDIFTHHGAELEPRFPLLGPPRKTHNRRMRLGANSAYRLLGFRLSVSPQYFILPHVVDEKAGHRWSRKLAMSCAC